MLPPDLRAQRPTTQVPIGNSDTGTRGYEKPEPQQPVMTSAEETTQLAAIARALAGRVAELERWANATEAWLRLEPQDYATGLKRRKAALVAARKHVSEQRGGPIMDSGKRLEAELAIARFLAGEDGTDRA